MQKLTLLSIGQMANDDLISIQLIIIVLWLVSKSTNHLHILAEFGWWMVLIWFSDFKW